MDSSTQSSHRHSAQCACIFKHDKKLKDVDMFANLSLIGKGAYGSVYKANDTTSDGAYVALKMVKMEKETQGFPVTALREIKILKLLRHENIVNLKDIVTYGERSEHNELKKEGFVKGDVFMVLEYVDNDLAGILSNRNIVLTEDHVKSYIKQILEGVCFMHSNNIFNRDIKPANILVTKDNQIKIADWGLARSYNSHEKNHKYTVPVVTLWYRAPELLLGLKEYNFAIDIWSVGCVFAEMKFKLQYQIRDDGGPANLAVFQGKDDADQLTNIYTMCGTPAPPILDIYKTYAKFNEVVVAEVHECNWSKRFPPPSFDDQSLDFLRSLLHYDPAMRTSASKALDNVFFFRPTAPKSHKELTKIAAGAHEFTAKHENEKKKQEMDRKRVREDDAGRGDAKRQAGGRGGRKPAASSKYTVKAAAEGPPK